MSRHAPEEVAAFAERLFDELKLLRTTIERGDATDGEIVDHLQTMIWQLGLVLGEF